ncbi:DUF3040 domain-containing protein [Nocardia lasii]|uniref:DUF3040 domain-containing protein n=1 Tax=Nocardia lasii TaxID=1616107 RepID=A0ABW1JR97_9NOCA
MPLSEHEQRMLEQIESALYAEDPKFASSVRGGRLRSTSSRRRFQAAALFAVGLFMLVAGIAVKAVQIGGFPIVSLLGFLAMFGAGVLLMTGNSRRAGKPDETETPAAGSGPSTGPTPRGGRQRKSGGFSERMEDRFRRRFEQE